MANQKKKPTSEALTNEKIQDSETLSLDMDLNFDISEFESPDDVPPVPDMTAVTLNQSLPTNFKPLGPDLDPPLDLGHGSDSLEEPISPPLPSVPGDLGAGSDFAQNKIANLKAEMEILEKEKRQLLRTGETYQRLNEDYLNEIQSLKNENQHLKVLQKQESSVLKQMGQAKDAKILELKKHRDRLQARMDSDMHGVQKKEKDLQHKLEIAKMEEAAVVKSKDQLILDLKRRIDRIQLESENFRKKSQANYKQLQDKNRVIRGVVRALRVALVKLEGDSDSTTGLEALSSVSQELKKSG